MKMIFVILFAVLVSRTFAQSFLSLDGIEAPDGGTILLYHYGAQNNSAYTPVYKFNAASGYEKKVMEAYFVDGSYTRSVQDFEFFPEDTTNFIDCGFGMMADNYAFVAYNDSAVAGFQSPFFYVDISRQNPLRTYAGDGMLNRSFDGGLTYPADSVLNFNMISVSDFNDNEIFGIDQQDRLIKSFDGGRTYIIVDDIPVSAKINFHPRLFYDPDQAHIYRINASVNAYDLYVSSDNGNSYTWTLKKQYPEPFVFTNDPSQSGTCYLGYYYHLYKSTNYAESFAPLYRFDERIIGIYPKPGTQLLYVATRYHLYSLENNTLTILKEISPDPELALYYPLKTGDKWVYDGFIRIYPETESYQFIREINDEVIKPNQKSYFEVEEYFAGSAYTSKYYERIDSANARVYRFDEDSVQSGQEYLLDDLRAELEDSVRSYRFGLTPFTVIYSADTVYYQHNTHYKQYYSESLMGYTYDLVKEFGITRVYNTFDFGSDDRILKGAIINGTLYGDTTLTGVEDKISTVSSFSLSQNYPNPFNPVTTIRYSIGKPVRVILKIFDILGKEVTTLVNEEKPSGNYSINFDGSNLASGIYYYQMRAGEYTQTMKFILLK